MRGRVSTQTLKGCPRRGLDFPEGFAVRDRQCAIDLHVFQGNWARRCADQKRSGFVLSPSSCTAGRSHPAEPQAVLGS